MTTYQVVGKAPGASKQCVRVSYYHESVQTRIRALLPGFKSWHHNLLPMEVIYLTSLTLSFLICEMWNNSLPISQQPCEDSIN